MDYLRKLGNLTSTLTFPYSLDEYIIPPNKTSPNPAEWTLQSGYDKKNKERVLIHRYALRKSSVENILVARKNVSKCKTLHHPYILKYKYSEEDSEYITLVTEYAIPLELYLEKNFDNKSLNDIINYGVLCVMECLNFLHNNVGSQLTNFSVNSVFVTQQLDWKISGFGCCTNVGDGISVQSYNKNISGNIYTIPLEMISVDNVDVWALACFLYVVYNWKNKEKWLRHLNQLTLKSYGNLPPILHKEYKQLLICDQIDLKNVIDYQKQHPGIFSNKAVVFRNQLQNLYLLNDDELLNFFYTYNLEIKYISPELGIFMLYPMLMNFYVFGKLLHIVQPAIICVIVNFLNNSLKNETDFKHFNHEELKNTIYQMWTSTDRGTRMYLLKYTEILLKYLNDGKNIGKKIVVHYVMGFNDSLLELKLESIKCIPIFVKTLPPNDTQNKLLPLLSKTFNETNNRHMEVAILNSFEKILDDLKDDAMKIIMKGITQKLKELIKRPTRIIHDILDFFVKNCSSIDSSLLICEVIPSVTHVLLSPNQLVRDDTLKCVNALISHVSQLVKHPSTPDSNEIYYDMESLSSPTFNYNLTIFDIETTVNTFKGVEGQIFENETLTLKQKPEINKLEDKIHDNSKANGWNDWEWNLELDEPDDKDSFQLAQPKNDINSSKKRNLSPPREQKNDKVEDLWDEWGDF